MRHPDPGRVTMCVFVESIEGRLAAERSGNGCMRSPDPGQGFFVCVERALKPDLSACHGEHLMRLCAFLHACSRPTRTRRWGAGRQGWRARSRGRRTRPRLGRCSSSGLTLRLARCCARTRSSSAGSPRSGPSCPCKPLMSGRMRIASGPAAIT
jgi:hypothetical protein